MSRLFLAGGLALATAGPAAAQCLPGYPIHPVPPIYFPAYPLTPAVWGAPAPRPLPPAPPPYVPKPAAGLREDDDRPRPKPAGKVKEEPKAGDPDLKDPPKISKPKLPLPGDPIGDDPPAVKPPGPRVEPPKKEPAGNGRQAVEQFFVPAGNRAEPRAQVQVGFFNHSDREITLDVNGESVRLPSEQYVTLRLPRSFKWAEKGQKATDVAVPPDADGIEIVFRK